MDKELLLMHLATERWKEIIFVDEVDSTNSHAARLLAEGSLRDGAVILAGRQTAGRGRFKRPWFSEGGLAMTAVVFTDAPLHQLGPAALGAGVAVAQGLREATGYGFWLKYPNDVMSARDGGKKVGGILVEAKPLEGGTALIIGIGVNVEQETFPEEIAGIATSLRRLGLPAQREEAAAHILNALAAAAGRPFCQLREEWLKMDCTTGKPVRIKNLKVDIEGTAVGLDGDGALLVQTADGTRRVTAGDVLFGG